MGKWLRLKNPEIEQVWTWKEGGGEGRGKDHKIIIHKHKSKKWEGAINYLLVEKLYKQKKTN